MEYGAAILHAFTAHRPVMGIADLADVVGLSRSTTHRYATTLVEKGWLQRASDGGRKYTLARPAAHAGAVVIGVLARITRCRPVLQDLRDKAGHTTGLGVLHGHTALYVQRWHAHRVGQHAADMELRTGSRVALRSSAVGKALLGTLPIGQLDQIVDELGSSSAGREASSARAALMADVACVAHARLVVSDEDQGPGVRAIAAPISAGRLALAVDLTVPASAGAADRLGERFGPLVKTAAGAIAENIRETPLVDELLSAPEGG
jgi:DNA-binding IclR family transcriptional regulator